MSRIRIIAIFGLVLISCQRNYTINSEGGPAIDEVIQFESLEKTSVIADSASSIHIKVSITPEADSAHSAIQIQTDRGYFSNGEKSVSAETNANKNANVTLFSGIEEGVANIRALVNSISIDTTIEFVKAQPSYLQMEPTILKTSNSKAGLNLSLLREKGRVGKDIKVDLQYKALDTTGVSLDLQPFLIVENVTDSIRVANPFDLTGRFEISASTYNQNSDTVSANAIVVFE